MQAQQDNRKTSSYRCCIRRSSSFRRGARAQHQNAMEAYGFFTDEEIEDTIASAGYKAGGRVGFDVGGPTEVKD